MIKYLYLHCQLLFIGINPHEGSFNRSVPFSNNKMFWYLLSRAGIISETIEELREDRKLKQIYDEKFNRIYKLGFINIIDRPTHDVSLLKKGEEMPGVNKIDSIIRIHKPRIVCFIGKVTYQKFTGTKDITFGWQPDLYNSKIYVMHFPIRGEASVRVNELKEVAAYAFPSRPVSSHTEEKNKI